MIACLTATASAQSAPSGPALLAHVQQHYAKVTNVRAAVRYVHEQLAGTATTSDGTVWIQRPSSYRFDFVKEKASRTVVRTVLGDGTTEWTIDHIGRWYRQSTSTSPFAIAVRFITTPAWTYQSLVVTTIDQSLELTAYAPLGAGYKSLTLVVDPTGSVKSSVVVDDSGDTHRFMFFEPSYDPTKPPAATLFQFSPTSVPNYAKKP